VASTAPGHAALVAVHDNGVYGVGTDLVYRAPAEQQLVGAAFSATGYAGRVEMYQQGVDDDGPPQQPRLAPGELLGVTAFGAPDCTTHPLGERPSLRGVRRSGHRRRGRYRAQPALVPAGGSVQLRLRSTSRCGDATPPPIADVQYADGTSATLALPIGDG
jgi:hypothetical protein